MISATESLNPLLWRYHHDPAQPCRQRRSSSLVCPGQTGPSLSQAARRRAVLRSLSGSALLAAVSERLPGGWQRPLIDTAALPAHAQSSAIGSPQGQAPVHLPGATIPPLPVPARNYHDLIGGTAEPKPFITVWEVAAGAEVVIPAKGEGLNYRVDWNDGTTEQTFTTEDAARTYETAGRYRIRIFGSLNRLEFTNSPGREQLVQIEKWGDIEWTDMTNAFRNCSNLQIAENAGAPDLHHVTSLQSMFRAASSMNASLNEWRVSEVTNMRNMFREATAFNHPLDKWNVAKVSNFSSMFRDSGFDQNIGSWDVRGREHAEHVPGWQA